MDISYPQAAKRQKGGIALILMVVLGMVAVIAGSTILYVNRQFNQTVEQEQEEKAFHVAEAGVNLIVFGLNESVYTTQGLEGIGSLEGSVPDGGDYKLTFAKVLGSRPGQNIRIIATGKDATERFCQSLDVVVHRTDEAQQQFVVDDWSDVTSCDVVEDITTCDVDGDCASGECDEDTNLCVEECTDNGDCLSGQCNTVAGTCVEECTADDQCGSGTCDEATGLCDTTCTSDADCGSGGVCNIGVTSSEGVCEEACTTDSDCSGGFCDESSGTAFCADECTSDAQCESNSCNENTGDCDIACTSDTDCSAGGTCDTGAGFCDPAPGPNPDPDPAPAPGPSPCNSDNDCSSGSCNLATNQCRSACESDDQCVSLKCNLIFRPGDGNNPPTQKKVCKDLCVGNSQCESNSCDPLTNTCDQECTSDSQCGSSETCNNGLCDPVICGSSCTTGTTYTGPCVLSATLGDCRQLIIEVSKAPTSGGQCGVGIDVCVPNVSYQSCSGCAGGPGGGGNPTPSCIPAPYCGDGTCDAGENADTCNTDCSGLPVSCDRDGICEPGESASSFTYTNGCIDCNTSSPTATPDYCPTPTPGGSGCRATCTDGQPNCAECIAADPGTPVCLTDGTCGSSQCGNNFCETISESPQDCTDCATCGNAQCEAGETTSCPGDCGGASSTPTSSPSQTPSQTVTPTPTPSPTCTGGFFGC